MFVSLEKRELLVSDLLHVRCLQTLTAFFPLSKMTHLYPIMCLFSCPKWLRVLSFFYVWWHSRGWGDKCNFFRGNISRGRHWKVKFVGLLASHFVSKDLPVFQLGNCFLYWKKMVSWLFWPIKAVLWFWPFGNHWPVVCLSVLCFPFWEPTLKYHN